MSDLILQNPPPACSPLPPPTVSLLSSVHTIVIVCQGLNLFSAHVSLRGYLSFHPPREGIEREPLELRPAAHYIFQKTEGSSEW